MNDLQYYKEMILKTVEPLKELGFVRGSDKLFEPAKPKLTEEQIQPPNYLDFFWKIKALCVSWEDCLTELFDYKKREGNTNVSYSIYSSNKQQLQEWVN